MGREVIITGGRPNPFAAPRLMVSRLLQHRRLVRHLVVRDLKVTYHGTIIGYGWTMLEPLLLTAVYWAVFALLRGNEDPLFVLEILLGVLVYGLFSKTMSQTTTGLVTYAGLIKQTSVPREGFLWSGGAFQTLRFMLSCLVIPPTMLTLELISIGRFCSSRSSPYQPWPSRWDSASLARSCTRISAIRPTW